MFLHVSSTQAVMSPSTSTKWSSNFGPVGTAPRRLVYQILSQKALNKSTETSLGNSLQNQWS